MRWDDDDDGQERASWRHDLHRTSKKKIWVKRTDEHIRSGTSEKVRKEMNTIRRSGWYLALLLLFVASVVALPLFVSD